MKLRTRIRPFSDAALVEGTVTDQDRAEHERQVRQARLERRRRWSRGAALQVVAEWFEDPPPGTTVNLGDGLLEMYLGGGIWQTVPTGSHGLGSPG